MEKGYAMDHLVEDVVMLEGNCLVKNAFLVLDTLYSLNFYADNRIAFWREWSLQYPIVGWHYF